MAKVRTQTTMEKTIERNFQHFMSELSYYLLENNIEISEVDCDFCIFDYVNKDMRFSLMINFIEKKNN